MKIFLIVLVCQMLQVHASSRYDRWFETYTTARFGSAVSPLWPQAVAMAESGLKLGAVSPVGAQGLMQFMPSTWADVAPEPWRSRSAFDPEAAIFVGIKYLRSLWNNTPTAALMHRKAFTNSSYNAGWGNIRKARATCRTSPGCDADKWDANVETKLTTLPQFQQETRNYVKRIREFENHLRISGAFS